MDSPVFFLHLNGSTSEASLQMKDVRQPRRPSELAASHSSTKPSKIFKKSLKSVCENSVCEGAGSFKHSAVVDEDEDENENEVGANCSPNLASSPISDGSILSDISHSSVSTVDNIELDSVSVEGIRTSSIESEIAVKFLKKIRLQVLDSVSVDPQSKKVVEFLIETAIDNIPYHYKERDQTTKLVHAKIAVVLVLLFSWILALVLYFGNLGGNSSFEGLVPT